MNENMISKQFAIRDIVFAKSYLLKYGKSNKIFNLRVTPNQSLEEKGSWFSVTIVYKIYSWNVSKSANFQNFTLHKINRYNHNRYWFQSFVKIFIQLYSMN